MKKIKKLLFKRFALKIKKTVSMVIFNAKTARRYHDTRYYEAIASEIKNLEFKEKEKKRLSTRKKKAVSKFLKNYRNLLNEKTQGVFQKLQGIYNKNKEAAFKGEAPPMNSKLLYLVSSLPILVTAYKKIKGNKGATTLAYILSDNRYKKLNALQLSFLNRTFHLPDGMNKTIFMEASRLLREGEYPWGASKRIYVEKPGKPGSLRPITIPPFMDRVIQAAILMVLEAIYEPWFEKKNCSFGFRPNKGVHDAIYKLTSLKNRGLDKAIEGDIKGAYDNVKKSKLISILEKQIKDRKFINLIKQRLDYQYWDSSKNKYIEEKQGIPQGGIDSPYLWNIYMMEFDNFVLQKTKTKVDNLNLKNRVSTTEDRVIPPGSRRRIEREKTTLRWMINVINKFPNDHEQINKHFKQKKPLELSGPTEKYGLKAFLKETNWETCYLNKDNTDQYKYALIKYNNKLTHSYFSLPPTNPSKKFLRFTYARYADDWILITNAPLVIVKELKEIFKTYLCEELSATMSDEKTLITNMRKSSAHFLGFEIRNPRSNKISRYSKIKDGKIKIIKANTAGKEIIALPDKQRLISRLHMKGYCTKKGFPREIPWLAYLEPFIIIERYNAVLRGFANFYTEFIPSPEKHLSRWVYIIRYSCLKTLAQKFKTNIGGVFKKFNYNQPKNSDTRARTIEIKVEQTINDKTYQKTWKLLTLKELITMAKNIGRKKEIENIYWSLEKGNSVEYSPKVGRIPAITDDSYLERISWVNLRTQASLDSPCVLCGSTTNIQMHHIKHIRKNRYDLIPEDRSYQQVMSLRNRKQIPVCKDCHLNVLHKGKYGGTSLNKLAPKIMYDNRLIVIESHIKPGGFRNYEKSLKEKGWSQTSALCSLSFAEQKIKRQEKKDQGDPNS